ncbi:class I SAM-dependent methyltransferase [Lishizhenia sp.]|uniref:class I SAM-dependent methyltransferase n=1 Tax=Lishizhenia sp. TaxID=2497594 RepID=UPI00299E90F4|nr:class I SAM-dependent methyltransferase [Lishizhenia sp.]MDX1447392.1 class I SAM-dependent methyltransferase [Lishizhenia sp.]
MLKENDAFGAAIADYENGIHGENIIVHSDICDDDVIPVDWLFRTENQMPEIEKKALELCKGKVLDIGACTGVHAEALILKGFEVETIDVSPGAVAFQQKLGINAKEQDFFAMTGGDYDTLLMMMNGIGIAGKLSELEKTLFQAKKLLKPGGQILCDSTDIKYLFEDEEGGMWVDLSTEYYGNFQFQMEYKDAKSEWFDWLYVDFGNLKTTAEKLGFNVELVLEDGQSYLAKLSLNA